MELPYPTEMKNIDNRELEIHWEDDHVSRYTFIDLRADCPCAKCVDEWTGERILRPETIAKDIRPTSISFVGNYAVQFNWSDDHNSGIYSFEKLRAKE
ncbi:MAG: DUF971 domain-containing protein [Candidatus Lindowbacteria bacterium]|nr:DUF971 domain-containing protein [Candidatus Lindowbacteria bacterium]